MMATLDAKDLLHAGEPLRALRLLQEQVRAKPGDVRLRVFLFQLLCVLGQWERALNQLDTAANLDPSVLAMKHMYGSAIACELLRAQVFKGEKAPLVLGQPEAWLALLIEALLRAGQGDLEPSLALREQAFADAPEIAGTLDDQPFTWIADADMRLGPVLEAIIDGRYFWIPFSRLRHAMIEAPADLRDSIWMPAHLQFDNGGESVALIPTRYPDSENCAEGLVALARKTLWEEKSPGCFSGLGQRVLTTDAGDFSLMDIRSIRISAPGE